MKESPPMGLPMISLCRKAVKSSLFQIGAIIRVRKENGFTPIAPLGDEG
jgi:hypothetical protein